MPDKPRPTADIIADLRRLSADNIGPRPETPQIMREAADRLESQARDVDRAVAALNAAADRIDALPGTLYGL